VNQTREHDHMFLELCSQTMWYDIRNHVEPLSQDEFAYILQRCSWALHLDVGFFK